MSHSGSLAQRVATLHDLMVELGEVELKLERIPNGKPDADALKTRMSELRVELDLLAS